MNEKRVIMIVGIILALGGWFGSALAVELKIGVVDIQRAINECNAGKEANKGLNKDLEKFQRLIEQKQKELQVIRESLDTQAKMLTPEAKVAKEKEFQTKLREFQRWGEDNQNELNQKQKEIERNISLGLQKVIQKIGVEEAYSLILEKNETIVLFASKTLDITDRVIMIFDGQKK